MRRRRARTRPKTLTPRAARRGGYGAGNKSKPNDTKKHEGNKTGNSLISKTTAKKKQEASANANKANLQLLLLDGKHERDGRFGGCERSFKRIIIIIMH